MTGSFTPGVAGTTSWTALISVVATILAVVVALFKEEIQRWWRRPKLDVAVRLTPPDCHKTKLHFLNPHTGAIAVSVDCYYLRVWVNNAGKQRASQVQVFASRLLREENGGFVEAIDFLPMNLKWATIDRPFLEGLSPQMGQYCNIGYVAQPLSLPIPHITLPVAKDNRTRLTFSLEVEPNSRSHIREAGRYRLELRVAAADCQPITRTIELFLSGDWYDTESEMFSKGLTMRDVS